MIGDLGGYYGLFLGGSAITLFELIDLVCYNSLLKLMTRKSNKRGRIRPANSKDHVIHVSELEEAKSANDPNVTSIME